MLTKYVVSVHVHKGGYRASLSNDHGKTFWHLNNPYPTPEAAAERGRFVISSTEGFFQASDYYVSVLGLIATICVMLDVIIKAAGLESSMAYMLASSAIIGGFVNFPMALRVYERHRRITLMNTTVLPGLRDVKGQ